MSQIIIITVDPFPTSWLVGKYKEVLVSAVFTATRKVTSREIVPIHSAISVMERGTYNEIAPRLASCLGNTQEEEEERGTLTQCLRGPAIDVVRRAIYNEIVQN